MSVVTFICIIIFFTFLLSGLIKKADFFSPARIFGMLWSAAVGLTDLKLSRLQFEWNLLQWYMLLLGLISFLLGCYISFTLNATKPFLSVENIRTRIQKIEINDKILYKIILSSFYIYAISFIAEYILLGYVPMFTAQPDKARTMFGVFGIHLIVNGINTILFLIVQYFVLVKKRPKEKFTLVLISLISFSSFLLLLQRYNFFVLGMMVICFLYYSGKQIKFRTLFIGFIFLIGLAFLIKNLRVGQLAELYFHTTAQMKIPLKYGLLSEPYMYITMNLENFVKNYSKIENFGFGFFTTDFLMALTGLKHWATEYFNLQKFPHYIAGFNTFPFYWVYYYDFGMLGLAFIPFLIGFIISETYYYLHRLPSLINLAIYSAGFSVIVFSYSSDPLTRLDMLFNYILIVLLQKYIIKKPINY